MKTKKAIALIGPNEAACSPGIREFGVELGRALTEAGYVILCGGMTGFMEAVCKGAKESPKTFFGATVGILPGAEKAEANAWCDIVIPTGMGIARNALLVRSADALVAVGGGSGTLSEIAFAWQMGKPLICVEGLGGWSEKMAGTRIDGRQEEEIMRAETVGEVTGLLEKLEI